MVDALLDEVTGDPVGLTLGEESCKFGAPIAPRPNHPHLIPRRWGHSATPSMNAGSPNWANPEPPTSP